MVLGCVGGVSVLVCGGQSSVCCGQAGGIVGGGRLSLVGQGMMGSIVAWKYCGYVDMVTCL